MSDIFGFVDAITQSPQKLKRRMGKVTSISSNYISVQVGGDTGTTLDVVRYFGHVAPCVGSHVWLDSDGSDIVAIGTITGLGSAIPATRLFNSTDQSIPVSSNYTSVSFDSQNVNGYPMLSIPGTTVSAPLQGMYLVQANVSFTTSGSSFYTSARIVRNGTAVAFAQTMNMVVEANAFHLSTVVSVAIGDLFGLQVRHGHSSPHVLNGGGNTLTALGVTYLGPSS